MPPPSTYVTAVTLTTDTDEQGRPLWRLDWTEERAGRESSWTMSHYTEAAARKHAAGLCASRPPATEVQDVFTDTRGLDG